MEVDGIVSEFGYDRSVDASVHWAPLMKIKDDHAEDECRPYIGKEYSEEWQTRAIDCSYAIDGYSWSPGGAIVRFTSEGLEVK